MNRVIPDAVGTFKVTLRLALCAGVALIAYVACGLAVRVRVLRRFARRVLKR